MKNLIFTTILILFSVLTFAQNWSPIRVNQKMNYQHSDSSYISHTIWVDSSLVEGNDSVFFTNKIVIDVPGNPEIVLRNQPQFLGEFLVKQQFGFYLIGQPYNFTIYASGDLGDSWSFSGISGISAEVTSLTTENIFGVTDSVKVISLSDGNEIKLSKNFGILKFPDFENVGYFEITGIQGTAYGESVPGILDIYDFEIGDVYQSFYDYSTVNSGSSYDFRYKKTVINKQQFEDSTQYEFHVLRHKREYWANNTTHHYYANYYEDLIIKNDPVNRENKFNHQLDIIEDTYVWIGTMELFTYCRINPDENGMIVKAFGDPEEDNDIQYLYFALEENTDTLYKIEDSELVDGYQGFTFMNGLGLTYSYSEEFWETYIENYLEGYVKDGDTVGIITPDSVLLAVSIEENNVQEETFEIYPNPASEILHIKTGKSQIEHFDFELRNSLGEVVQKVNNIIAADPVIRIEGLKSGIYFYTAIKDFQILAKGKVLIR
ncbi:MAG: T9SS type A sorting domain-containing protein [Bacteroidetes bacterium]|nr:T9SS type A sorting domain-containing protein [Bacteroidota bacterium]